MMHAQDHDTILCFGYCFHWSGTFLVAAVEMTAPTTLGMSIRQWQWWW
jgi:hypothetical protein